MPSKDSMPKKKPVYGDKRKRKPNVHTPEGTLLYPHPLPEPLSSQSSDTSLRAAVVQTGEAEVQQEQRGFDTGPLKVPGSEGHWLEDNQWFTTVFLKVWLAGP